MLRGQDKDSGSAIPLFPLNVVLFPGGPLPLRILGTTRLAFGLVGSAATW